MVGLGPAAWQQGRCVPSGWISICEGCRPPLHWQRRTEIFMLAFSGLLLFYVGKFATVAFLFGAVTSILSGWLGMKVPTSLQL